MARGHIGEHESPCSIRARRRRSDRHRDAPQRLIIDAADGTEDGSHPVGDRAFCEVLDLGNRGKRHVGAPAGLRVRQTGRENTVLDATLFAAELKPGEGVLLTTVCVRRCPCP